MTAKISAPMGKIVLNGSFYRHKVNHQSWLCPILPVS
jgi:hypothetical protein